MRLLSRPLILLFVTLLPLIILHSISGVLGNQTAVAYTHAPPPVYTARGVSETFTILPTPTAGRKADISGDCTVYRGAGGAGVYLHNLTTDDTISLTTKAELTGSRKVVISQGMIIWRSDIASENGLWGYYTADCNDSLWPTSPDIGPFHVISRANAHTPALSGEMLTFDTWDPAGAWYVAMLELDADDNNIPDAAEAGYDPTDLANFRRLTCCAHIPGDTFYQRVSAIYWDDTYQIACWHHEAITGTRNRLECNELSNWQEPAPWQDAFVVVDDAAIVADFGGVIAVHRDLVVWTTAQEADLTGYDLYIADLDGDDDGILDAPEEIAIYHLVNWPWHQQYPDIEWPFVVWTEYRNENQADIYAYDLSLDSNGDGIPNWKDPTRFCIDPAEFPVATGPTTQIYPKLSVDTVIWLAGSADAYELHGAYLVPEIATPRPVVTGTPLEKAIHWLDQQTVRFATVQEIPGYISATGMISRYKSFTITPTLATEVRKAWYEAIPGDYVVGFDYCYFGTPDHKRYLGRFGRGFIYDQALGLIVHTMLSQPMAAENLGLYISSFQNKGQLPTLASGSFGFSFNGQGFWGEKDNFYDMDYLRGGANGWLGYGYLFYSRQFNNLQFMEVMTGVGDYLLTLQYTTTITDPRYGLFLGGYGRWFEDFFFDQNVAWAATEHNIDVYFFLRDLGELTGDSRYTNAALLQKKNMANLWNESLGRFDQGAGDDANALDAASWGAMYLIATGDIISAMRSLEFADQAYFNTITVSDTIQVNPAITVSGYKPYTGTVDEFDWSARQMVWSEGSLGVALAKLKLGYTLLDHCHDTTGYAYIQEAEAIVAEMEKLQTVDPGGGLFYTAYPGEEINDFARAPSVAGTAWFLMAKQAMADPTWRDTFWSVDADVSWNCPPQIFLPIIMN